MIDESKRPIQISKWFSLHLRPSKPFKFGHLTYLSKTDCAELCAKRAALCAFVRYLATVLTKAIHMIQFTNNQLEIIRDHMPRGYGKTIQKRLALRKIIRSTSMIWKVVQQQGECVRYDEVIMVEALKLAVETKKAQEAVAAEMNEQVQKLTA